MPPMFSYKCVYASGRKDVFEYLASGMTEEQILKDS